MKRANVSAFASGASECGKSRLLWDVYTSHFPRVLTFDPVGDTLERNPAAVPVRTAAELWRHLRAANAQGADRWHFVLWGGPEEVVAAFDRLAPLTAAPDERTLARELGGIIFETGELDTLAPNAATPLSVAMRGRWQRGRHHLVSFAVATQAPALVSRIVTANSQHIYAFAHNEHTSLNYFRQLVGDRATDAIAGLAPFSYLHWQKGQPTATVYATQLRPGGEIRRRAVQTISVLIRK